MRVFIPLLLTSILFLTGCGEKELLKSPPPKEYHLTGEIKFYHREGCPHCEEEEKALVEIGKQYPDLKITPILIDSEATDPASIAKMKELEEVFSKQPPEKRGGLPLTTMGDWSALGWDSNIEKELTKKIVEYQFSTEK